MRGLRALLALALCGATGGRAPLLDARTVERVHGTVNMCRGVGVHCSPIGAKRLLADNAAVVTSERSMAAVRFESGTSLLLGENGMLVVGGSALDKTIRVTTVELSSGAVALDSTADPGSRIIALTPLLQMSIRGLVRMYVVVQGVNARIVCVRCDSGSVAVSSAGFTYILWTGETAWFFSDHHAFYSTGTRTDPAIVQFHPASP